MYVVCGVIRENNKKYYVAEYFIEDDAKIIKKPKECFKVLEAIGIDPYTFDAPEKRRWGNFEVKLFKEVSKDIKHDFFKNKDIYRVIKTSEKGGKIDD